MLFRSPHRTRRMEIIHAHPEVTKLMGHSPLTKYIVLVVVSLQIATAAYFRNTHPLTLSFVVCAYVLGGTANHNLFLAIHEITHNLAFRSVVMNRLLAVFANLPIGVPYAAAFKVSVQAYLEGADADACCKRGIILNTTSFWVRMESTRICRHGLNCCF